MRDRIVSLLLLYEAHWPRVARLDLIFQQKGECHMIRANGNYVVVYQLTTTNLYI